MSGSRIISATIIALVALGCSEGPATHPVSGRVELAPGRSVNVGTIAFIPSGKGPSARGALGAGGRYRLSTFGEGDGAPLGEYTVVISQPQLATGAVQAAPQEHLDEHHDGSAEPTGVVPQRFSRPRESGLTAVVRPGENSIDFVLTEESDVGVE